jgi:GT2 family glycosyltransferase
LTFTDDDVDADRSWLESIARAFQDARIILVGGRSLPRYEAPPPDWVEYQWADTPYGRYLTYLSLLDLGDEPREIDPIFVFGLNYSIRKQALLKLKGFNPDCVPDYLLAFLGDGETGLSIKAKAAGYRAWYDPNVLVYHRIPAHRLTTAYFEKRAFGQGVSDSYTLLRRRGGHLRLIDRARVTKLLLAQTIDGALVRCFQLGRGETKTTLRNRFRIAYRDGFRFHMSQAVQSGALMEWVTRDSYLSDYRLPQTTGVPAEC